MIAILARLFRRGRATEPLRTCLPRVCGMSLFCEVARMAGISGGYHWNSPATAKPGRFLRLGSNIQGIREAHPARL
jgi:hypothetical protein